MSDEAIVRIVLDGSGAGTTPRQTLPVDMSSAGGMNVTSPYAAASGGLSINPPKALTMQNGGFPNPQYIIGRPTDIPPGESTAHTTSNYIDHPSPEPAHERDREEEKRLHYIAAQSELITARKLAAKEEAAADQRKSAADLVEKQVAQLRIDGAKRQQEAVADAIRNQEITEEAAASQRKSAADLVEQQVADLRIDSAKRQQEAVAESIRKRETEEATRAKREEEIELLVIKAHLQVAKEQEALAEAIRKQRIENDPINRAINAAEAKIAAQKQSDLVERYHDFIVEKDFDPKAEAYRQVEREDREARARDRELRTKKEYDKLDRPEAPHVLFDPEEKAIERRVAEARKKTNEHRQKAVDKAYEKLFGKSEKQDADEKTGDSDRGGYRSMRFISDLLGQRAGHFARYAKSQGWSKTMSMLSAAPIAAVDAASNVAGAAANPNADPSSAISGMGSAVSQVGNTLAQVNPVLGGMVVAAGEAAKALGGFMDAVNATAKRYSEFSPDITQAQAIAEIKQTMGDFRRAQEISGEMTKFLMAQSDIQQTFEDAKVKVLNKLLPIATKMLEVIEGMSNSIVPEGYDLGDVLAASIEPILAPIEAILDAIGEILGIKREEIDKDRKGDIIDPTDMLLAPDREKVKGFR